MRRLVTLLALTSVASVLLVVAPGPAGAGGSCAMGPFTDARGTEVHLSRACFNPMVLRIDEGDEVTFRNMDPDLHMVGGVSNVFGNMHTELEPDASIAYTFNEEGVFPYVCILHPRMAGAIVVGDGNGKVSESSVTGGTVVPPSDETATDNSVDDAVPLQPEIEPTSSNSTSNLGLLAVVLVAMTSAFWLARRRRQVKA